MGKERSSFMLGSRGGRSCISKNTLAFLVGDICLTLVDILFGRRIEALKLGPPVVKLSFANIRSDILAYKFSAHSNCKSPVTIRQSHSQSLQEKFWTFSGPDISFDIHLFLHLDTAYEMRGRGLVLDFYGIEDCMIENVNIRVDYLSSLSSLIRRYLPALIVYPAGIELIQTRGRSRWGHILRGLLYASVIRYAVIWMGYDAAFMLLGHHSAGFAWDYFTLVVLMVVGGYMLDLYHFVAVWLGKAGSFFGNGNGQSWSVIRALFYGLFLAGTVMGLPNQLVVIVSFIELWTVKNKSGEVRKMYLLHLMLLAITIPQLLPWVQGIPVVGLLSWDRDRNPIYTIPFLVLGSSLTRKEGLGRRGRVVLPILCKVGGWVLILFGLTRPHLFEGIMWVIVTSLAVDYLDQKRE